MILEARTKNLNKISQLHRDLLKDTFNSRVGPDFVKSLYGILIRDGKRSQVWVAKEKKEIVGFISFCKNLNSTSKILKRKVSPKAKVKVILFLLIHPLEIISLTNKMLFEKYISDHFEVYPSILTIGVSPQNQRRGLGMKLIRKADEYFKRYSSHYFVDTLVTNINARKFYKKAEFREIKTIYGNVILKKEI